MNKKPMIFVAMSSADKYEDFYTVIRVMAADLGAEAKRVDDDKVFIKRIRPEIIQKIKQADIIVAEISSPSLNVLYEVGWAHALGKPTILFADQNAEIPFDIQDFKIIKYDYDENMTTKKLELSLRLSFEQQFNNLINRNNFRQPVVDLLEAIDDFEESNNLFSKLSVYAIEKLTEGAKQWLGDSIVINESEAVEKGIRIFQNLENGGFATYLVNINDYWNKDNDYLRECRNVSKNRGKQITRVYILPNFDSLNNSNLQELMRLDEEANIETKIVFESELSEKDVIKDFGIWDDEVVCLMKVSSSDLEYKVTGGYFSRNENDLEKARYWKNVILASAKSSKGIFNSISNLNKPTQLLLKSVSKMELAADTYCQGSYLPKHQESCKWYHSAWPYLRLLGLVSTPDWHGDFYIKALGNIDFSKVKQVLISGTADYSMLSYVLAAIPHNYIHDITITVLDICETPLAICRWYKENYEQATNQKFNLRYDNSDALDTMIQEESIDLIITDAFLTRFGQQEKEKLVDEWKRILKPNGSIITTARMAHKTIEVLKANQMGINRFCERATNKITENFPWLTDSMNHILQHAREYGLNMCSYPIASIQSLNTLFSEFILEVETANIPGEFEETSQYSRIVAQKPTSKE
jgi:hypothetical protein